MAFARGLADRPEGTYFRNPQSPREDSASLAALTAAPLSPLRSFNGRVNGSPPVTNDARGVLQRRFTTNALPTLSPIGQQRRQAAEPREYSTTTTTSARMTPAERKARQYEELLAQQRRIQAQMAMIDPETRREVDEVRRLEQDITRFTSGVLSEPSTPPEHYANLFTPKASASNRYSTSSMTSPPGFSNRTSRSGSQITSPPVEKQFSSHAASQLPSKSVPGSQRNSDHEDDDDDYAYGFPSITQRAPNPNRNSMPVTAYDRRNQTNSMANLSSLLGSVNTTSFLFGDDDEHKPAKQTQSNVSPDTKTYLQLHTTNDQFPILVRRETDGNSQFSPPSAIQDLATSQAHYEDNYTRTDRATAARHRQSLPPSAMRQTGLLNGEGMAPLNSMLSEFATAKNTAANRRSMEVKFSGIGDTKRPSLLHASPARSSMNGLPKVQSSYSTNDIPTLKTINVAMPTPQDSVTAQSPATDLISPDHHSYATVSSPTATPGSRNTQQTASSESTGGYRSPQSGLQPSATPFGPVAIAPTGGAASGASMVPNAAAITAPVAAPYVAAPPAYYAGYGMQMINSQIASMQLGNHGQWPNLQNPYAAVGQYNQPPVRFPDSRPGQPRRAQAGDDSSRYNGVALESLVGEMYTICKDQHGCRYLQRKIEDRNPEHLRVIFEEITPHVTELMTDPFGNYLCQKLIEYANDDQRTALIRSAAPQMVTIALNQHGTRALQKTIEFVSTREQISMVIDSLKYHVVPLIQDLNGNHVIQKCLNHLASADAQFVIDAVCAHVVTVGTHRHGCCVLQRCVDHSSEPQRVQLVQAITTHALSLVQDPFGNYVVQYILDIDEPKFTTPLCQSFCGNVVLLSRQKFSSNVMEKAIRSADDATRCVMIEEMLDQSEIEAMLRDSYGNYVVQTSMDFADAETKARFVELIRPIIPTIRHTPHGRRISSKVLEYESRLVIPTNGHVTPVDTRLQATPIQGHQQTSWRPHAGFGSVQAHPNGNPYVNGIVTPHTQRHGAQGGFMQQHTQYQPTQVYGRPVHPGGVPQQNGNGVGANGVQYHGINGNGMNGHTMNISGMNGNGMGGHF